MKIRGFTLIELLAVIIILGIVIAIAITTVSGIIESTNKDGFKSSLKIALKQARNKIVTGSTGGSLGTLNITQNNLYGEWYSNDGVATIKAGSSNKDYMIATDVTLDNVLSVELIPVGVSDPAIFNNSQVASTENITTNTLSSYFEQLNIYGKSTQEGYALTINNSTTYNNGINLGIPWNTTKKIETDISSVYNVSDPKNMIFSTWVSASTKTSPYMAYSYNGPVSISGLEVGTTQTPALISSQYGDGTRRKLTYNFSTQTNTGAIFLGAWSDSVWSRNQTVYGIKIWDTSDVLVRDMIPVPQGSTIYSNTPAPSNCLWDKITKIYYTNTGSTAFTITNAVSPDNPININSSSNFNLISAGKNLIEYPYYSQSSSQWFVNSDNSINVNVDTGTNQYVSFHFKYNSVLPAGQYTFSCGSNDVILAFYYKKTDGTYTWITVANNNSFTLSSDLKYDQMYLQINPNKSVHNTIYPQIEKGTTATTYSKYISPNQTIITSTLRSIQVPSSSTDYTYTDGTNKYISDYIELKDGKVNLVKNIGYSELRSVGSVYYTGTDIIRYGRYTVPDIPSAKLNSGMLSIQLPYYASDWHVNRESIFWHSDYTVNFYFSLSKTRLDILGTDTDAQKLTKVNNYLSTNPFTIQYILLNPITTDITNTTEGQNLLLLKSQSEYTRLYISGSDLNIYIKSQVKVKK